MLKDADDCRLHTTLLQVALYVCGTLIGAMVGTADFASVR